MSRETYEANIQFMEHTLARIEQNNVSIDELESLAIEFAQARKFCSDRLARIEAGLQDALRLSDASPSQG